MSPDERLIAQSKQAINYRNTIRVRSIKFSRSLAATVLRDAMDYVSTLNRDTTILDQLTSRLWAVPSLSQRARDAIVDHIDFTVKNRRNKGRVSVNLSGIDRRLSTAIQKGVVVANSKRRDEDDYDDLVILARKSIAKEITKVIPYLSRLVQYESSRIYNEEVTDEVEAINWKRAIVATFDTRTGADSILIHGQVVGPREPFWDEFHQQWFMNPPNRPNDREMVVPWNPVWGLPHSGPDAIISAVASGTLDADTARSILVTAKSDIGLGNESAWNRVHSALEALM